MLLVGRLGRTIVAAHAKARRVDERYRLSVIVVLMRMFRCVLVAQRRPLALQKQAPRTDEVRGCATLHTDLQKALDHTSRICKW